MISKVIMCRTKGEASFAQDILFSKGYSWTVKGNKSKICHDRMAIIERDKRLTYLRGLDRAGLEAYLTEEGESYQIFNLSELCRL